MRGSPWVVLLSRSLGKISPSSPVPLSRYTNAEDLRQGYDTMLDRLPLLLAQNRNDDSGMWGILVIGAIVVIGGIIALVLLVAFAAYGKTWFQAYMSSADVSMLSLIGMGFRQVNSAVIVRAKIMAGQAGLDINRRTGISTQRLEAHYLAGGNVMNVMNAIIAAHRAGIPLDFDQAAAIDLAGRDVLDAVRTSVNPKVIDCPDPRRSANATL